MCRFNLLREESEGYAKLLTLLNQVGPGAVAPGNTKAVVSHAMTGCDSGFGKAGPGVSVAAGNNKAVLGDTSPLVTV